MWGIIFNHWVNPKLALRFHALLIVTLSVDRTKDDLFGSPWQGISHCNVYPARVMHCAGSTRILKLFLGSWHFVLNLVGGGGGERVQDFWNFVKSYPFTNHTVIISVWFPDYQIIITMEYIFEYTSIFIFLGGRYVGHEPHFAPHRLRRPLH